MLHNGSPKRDALDSCTLSHAMETHAQPSFTLRVLSNSKSSTAVLMVIARIGKLLPWGSLLTAMLCSLGAPQCGRAQTAPAVSPGASAAPHKTPAASDRKHVPGKHVQAARTASAKNTSGRLSRTAHGRSLHSRRVARHVHSKRRPRSARSIARSRRLQQAFVASSQLRPMAQELASTRAPAAYEGVAAYARAHSGEAAAAAYLALGHAYLIDRRYPEAIVNLEKARTEGKALDDYADFLIAQAQIQSGKLAAAQTVLEGFAGKYPESIFVSGLPVTIANLSLGQGDPQEALRVLRAHAGDAVSGHADYQFALARADQMSGNIEEASRLYRHIFLTFPLRSEGQQAKMQLAQTGAAAPLTLAERRSHADALYAGGRYGEAGDEYRALAAEFAGAGVQERNALLVAAAACDWKLNRLTRQQAEALPDTQDENGARRLYLLMELARDRNDADTQQAIVAQMEERFPASPWLEDALHSSGNMCLLSKDYPRAIGYYQELAKRFPRSRYGASSQWKAAWLNYQLGNYSDAARLIDAHIALYPNGKELSAALYWRGRIYEDQERRPEMAAAYYKAVSTAFEHYYYAEMARDRLAALGNVKPADSAMLDNIQPEQIPALTDDVPQDDEHVIKARLLANAGLNEYIAPEIQAADGSREWGAFAEAEIYASDGEAFRAMSVLKRALPFYSSAPIDALPMGYWKILFPQPYWGTIEEEARKNNLDPYMVAALIRQETEFNPQAISNRNAYGLMQLLPSVGSSMAKKEGIHHFRTEELLDPATNIRLGTLYLKEMLDRFGGKPEYAFAAYNAGDNRVTDWQSIRKFNGMDEFVESIPFTETREYVQAIMRNEAIYRELNHAELSHAAAGQPAVAARSSNTIAQQ